VVEKTNKSQNQQKSIKSSKFEDLNYSVRKLFYRNGFFRTGMRDIAKEAGMSLSNLYVYFPSKEVLGLHYLEEEEKSQIIKLTKLMELNPNPKTFFRVWLISKKSEAKRGEFVGCPFSSFSHQTLDLDPKLNKSIQEFTRIWEKLLIHYIEKSIKLNFLSKNTNSSNFSQRILSHYQGTIAMWRMSKDNKYWKILDQLISEELDRNSP
jgi:AcrR family transcriptional regulator